MNGDVRPEPVPFAWLAAATPDAGEQRALSAWSALKGVSLVQPARDAPAPLALDLRLVGLIETEIERARDALAAHEADEVDRHLLQASRALDAHPELPNASWLLAEVERTRAARLVRLAPTDIEAASRAWARASALDGGRAAGASEDSPLLEAAVPAPGVLNVILPSGAEAVWLDGRPAPPGPHAVGVGEHAVVVTFDDAPVWAGWVQATPVPGDAPPLLLPAPIPAPCSEADLHEALVLEGSIRQAQRVRCARWVAATAGLLPDSIRVAVCEAGQCGPLLVWRTLPPLALAPGPPHATHAGHRIPAWALLAGAAAGVAIAGGLAVAAAAGAFRSRPAEARFVSGGLR